MKEEDYIMEENLHKWRIERDNRERKNKIYCSTGKNKLPEIAYLSKDLLLGLKFSFWLGEFSFSDRLKTPING